MIDRPFHRGVQAALPMLTGTVLFGLATGAATAPSGLSLPAVLAMPAVLYAGVGQLAYAQLFALAAPFASILLTLALINLRYLIYAAIASTWPQPRNWLARILTPYFVTETSFALSLREAPEHRIAFMLGAGTALWATWFLTCTVGALLASQLPPLKHAYAVPAIVLAPVIAALLKDRKRLGVAALACTLGLAFATMPYRLGPLVAAPLAVAVVLLAAAVWARRR
ncbi:MAG: AzlC family ABC transporter permease [Rhodospirillales bacterium]